MKQFLKNCGEAFWKTLLLSLKVGIGFIAIFIVAIALGNRYGASAACWASFSATIGICYCLETSFNLKNICKALGFVALINFACWVFGVIALCIVGEPFGYFFQAWIGLGCIICCGMLIGCLAILLFLLEYFYENGHFSFKLFFKKTGIFFSALLAVLLVGAACLCILWLCNII